MRINQSIGRGYTTPAAMSQPREMYRNNGRKYAVRFWRLPSCAICRHAASLGQQVGIFLAEHFGAEAGRRVELRFVEAPVVIAGIAQRIDQRLRRRIELVMNL